MTSSTAGWTASPNNRGTFDIIRSCLQTIVLCAWTSICVNVPAPDRGQWDLIKDKFHFVLLTFLGPELVFLLAFTQYQSAQASVQQFKAGGWDQWTLVHGFYADMGGIHVRDQACGRFPVNAKQLYYLVSRGYISYPEIPLAEIQARSKIDGLARVITICQTLYFTVSTLARVPQNLAMTTLELTVLGFIFCTLATSFCWWSKPTDVEMSHVFDLNADIGQIFLEGGDDATIPYRNTPLDFVDHPEWVAYNLWTFYVNILRQMRLYPGPHKKLPIQKFSSFNFPKPQSQMSAFIILLVSISYSTIFIAAWNFYFPSQQEKVIWRALSIGQIFLIFAGGLFETLRYRPSSSSTQHDLKKTIISHSKVDTSRSDTHGRAKPQSILSKLWNRPINNSPGRQPSLDVPLESMLIMTPICAAYCLVRCFILVEDIIGLRSVPSSAYVSVDWTRYWPFFSS